MSTMREHIKKENHFSMIEILMFLVLFLLAFRFLGQQSEYIAVLAVLWLIRLVQKNTPIVFNAEFFLLMITFLLYTIFYSFNYGITLSVVLQWTVGVLAMYGIGRQMGSEGTRKMIVLILVVALGMFLHGFINLINHDFATQGRNPIDIWTGSYLAATQQNVFFTMGVALFFPALFVMRGKLIKILAVFLFAATILNSMATATRTGLLLPALSFLTILIVFIAENRKTLHKLKYVFLFLVAAFFVLLIVFIFNIFGIREKILNSPLFNRDESSGLDPRFTYWYRTLAYMFQYPFGGAEFRQLCGNYAHNLWLDIIQNAGILVGLLYLAYTVMTFVNIVKLFKNKKVPVSLRYILLSEYVSIMINCMIETILDGVPLMLLLFFLLNGMTAKLNEVYSSGTVQKSLFEPSKTGSADSKIQESRR